MLLYCENCRQIVEEPVCPFCGEKKVREPLPNDPCFLCEKQIVWGEMLEDALKEAGIPVLAKNRMGAGMAIKVGLMLERVRLYVPFARYEEAVKIADDLFAEADSEPDKEMERA